MSIIRLTLNNSAVENLRIVSSTSFSNYSFEKSLNEFLNYLRSLVNQYRHEIIFIQLFEYMCTIFGLSLINLDRLKQEIRTKNEYQQQIYNDVFNKIEKLSRSVKVLLELNKMKISHLDQHSIIINSFNQFHQNFNVGQYNFNFENNLTLEKRFYLLSACPRNSVTALRFYSFCFVHNSESKSCRELSDVLN